jgi:hypothetical protein
MDKKREKGEGERMAEEVISYIQDEFYGGINAN